MFLIHSSGGRCRVMKLSGSYGLDCSPEIVFKIMTDPAALYKCIPGCRELCEVEPIRTYTCDLTYGYKVRAQVGQIHTPSWLWSWIIRALRSFSIALKALNPKLLRAFTNVIRLSLKLLKRGFPSSLGHFKTDLVVEGAGSAGTIKGIIDFVVDVRKTQTLIKYEGNIYLGGPAALLASWSSSAGGLDFGKLVNLFFENLDNELIKARGGRDRGRVVAF